MTRFPFLLLVLLSVLLTGAYAWRTPTTPKKASCDYRKIASSLATSTFLFLNIVDPAAASKYEPPLVVPKVAGGSGGIDAVGSAFSAVQVGKMKALSNNEFAQVQAGTRELSNEPRALKRRVLAACKDNNIRELAKTKMSEKECINKVMDNDIDEMVEAMKQSK